MQQAAHIAETNFAFVDRMRREYDLSYKELADLTAYSEESVRAWFADHDSSKFRPVPDRAVTILRLQLEGKAKSKQ